MRANQLIAIAVAAMLLLGGAAALGAASPADQAHDNSSDAYDDYPADEADEADAAGDDERDDRGANASEDRAGNADGVGPSDGLPEQVPSHVGEIHDTIESFLTGGIDNLGEALHSLLGGGEVADDAGHDAADKGADNADDDGAGDTDAGESDGDD